GTRMQQRTKKLLRDKQAVLKNKYTTYKTNVDKFNTDYPSQNPITCPSFEDIKSKTLADQFWDIGQLTHPNEPWAVDQDTRDGIRAYLDMTHAHDEVRRVGRGVRQSINWALQMQEKLSVLETALTLDDDDPTTIPNKWIVEVAGLPMMPIHQHLSNSKSVLRSLYGHLSQEHARLWMVWNSKMTELLNNTKPYSELLEEDELTFRIRWEALAAGSRQTWQRATQAAIVEATPLDNGAEAELEVEPYEDIEGGFVGDDDDEIEINPF
ncbi:hypothetical protein DFH28DRAFT_893525, partial [Melampsora americana]